MDYLISTYIIVCYSIVYYIYGLFGAARFSSEHFQQRLRGLYETLSGANFYVERRKMVLQVQIRVIPKYGFKNDLGGVLDMVVRRL